MTLIRYAGSAAVVALLTTSLFALQNAQKPQAASDKGCNALRVITVPLTADNLNKPNTIEDSVTTVCRNDMVAWHFINPTDAPIDIELRGFHLCSDPPDKKVKPVKFRGGWFDDDSDSAVQPRSSVTMLGRVVMRGGPGEGTCVKYSIRLRARGQGRVEHDPKLQIVEP